MEECKNCHHCKQPSLGLATTYELITELWVRVDVAKTIGKEWPQYKTLDLEKK